MEERSVKKIFQSIVKPIETNSMSFTGKGEKLQRMKELLMRTPRRYFEGNKYEPSKQLRATTTVDDVIKNSQLPIDPQKLLQLMNPLKVAEIALMTLKVAVCGAVDGLSNNDGKISTTGAKIAKGILLTPVNFFAVPIQLANLGIENLGKAAGNGIRNIQARFSKSSPAASASESESDRPPLEKQDSFADPIEPSEDHSATQRASSTWEAAKKHESGDLVINLDSRRQSVAELPTDAYEQKGPSDQERVSMEEESQEEHVDNSRDSYTI